MSLIGNSPITIPDSVTVDLKPHHLEVVGPLGTLKHQLPREIKAQKDDHLLTFQRSSHLPAHRALHGLTRALAANMVEGVTKGFEKRLEMVGTGYRVAKTGTGISLSVGLSHSVELTPPPGITLEVEGNNKIIIKGIDKYLVGQTAANIRNVRKPEPYKGKGIRYEGEVVRRKAGKAAKVGAA